MLFTELVRSRVLGDVHREASYLLSEICETLDVRPMPDGGVRFAFQGSFALLERLGTWGSQTADLEPDACAEAPDDAEDDNRADPVLREVVPTIDVTALNLAGAFELPEGVPQEMAGAVRELYAVA